MCKNWPRFKSKRIDWLEEPKSIPELVLKICTLYKNLNKHLIYRIVWLFFLILGGHFKTFLHFFILSSAKKIRRRIFYDTYPPHIVIHRNWKTPSPPKKVRRLLWTAPKVIIQVQTGMEYLAGWFQAFK